MLRLQSCRFPLLSLLLLLLFLSSAAASQERKLSPRLILKRMADNYAACSSYQDTGVVETTYHEASSGRIDKMPFKLYFKRPNLLRFEWIDYLPWKDGRMKIVWSNGRETFTYWEPDSYEKDESLSMGIAGATGISRGAAHTIPRMLLEEIGGFVLTELTGLALVGEEVFENEPCYRISGKHPSGDVFELWIGKRDFLLRKERTQTTAEGDRYTIEEEIHRNIKINGPIAAETFNFKPPIALTQRKESELEVPPPGDENPVWSEFHSEEGRFKLLMPTKPMAQTLTLETAQGQIVHHGFTAARGGLICIIDYADLPKPLIDPTTMKLLFDQARDEFLKTMEGKLSGETTISIEGHPGREVRIAFSGGEARANFFLVNERFYQLAFMSMNVFGKSSVDADKFFNSFKLVANPKQVVSLPLRRTMTPLSFSQYQR
jgi:outer membrane lipoprotein-sorting protein